MPTSPLPPADSALLAAHLAGDASAFPALLARHLHMVHAAAVRQLPAHADDITQAVFLLLHQKARSLQHRPSLAGWLFTTTRLCAAYVRRSESRRRNHELEAAMRTPEPPLDHSALFTQLDQALASLRRSDRELVLLHHLQNRPFEEIAARLQLSVPAAARRTQRAVERLRTWFTHHGHSVPASSLTSALLTQSAHRAPAALAATHATASATAIAKSTAPLLFSTALKLTAAAASLALVAGAGYAAIELFRTSPAPAVPVAAAAPAAPVPPPAPLVDASDESKLPGTIRLARFDAPMTAAAAEEFKKLLTPIETSSTVYVGYRAFNDAVISGLRQTFAGGQFIPSWAHPSVVFSETASDATLPLHVEDAPVVGWQGRRTFFNDRWGGNLNGTGAMSVADDSLRLTIDLTDTVNRPRGAPPPATTSKSIHFNGTLKAGESLLFFADVSQTIVPQQLVHIMLWQAFKATDDQMQTITKTDDSVDWIKRGPVGARVLADRTLLWQSRAPGAPIPETFIRTLANGATIRLIALSSPDEFPYCWWRPDGLPSKKDWVGDGLGIDYNSGGLATLPVPPHALILQLDTPDLPKPDQPLTAKSPQTVRYFNQSHVESLWPIRTDLGPIDVGIAAGPWKDFLSIPGPADVNKDNIAVHFHPLNTSGHNDITCTIDFQSSPDTEIRVLAIDLGGHSLPSVTNNNAPENWPSITLIRTPAETWQSLNLYLAGPLDIIDHFLIQTRKREWTTFSDYATTPTTPIPETPDPAEVAAIRQKLEAGASAQAATKQAARDALLTHPDPATPAGASALFLLQIRSGDAATARAFYSTTTPEQAAYADALARYFSAQESLRLASEKRFGTTSVRDFLINTSQPLLWDEERYFDSPWQIDGDRALQKDSGFKLVRSGNTWRRDMSDFSSVPTSTLKEAARLENIKSRFDAGEFATIDALATALTLPPSPPGFFGRPATAPSQPK